MESPYIIYENDKIEDFPMYTWTGKLCNEGVQYHGQIYQYSEDHMFENSDNEGKPEDVQMVRNYKSDIAIPIRLISNFRAKKIWILSNFKLILMKIVDFV